MGIKRKQSFDQIRLSASLWFYQQGMTQKKSCSIDELCRMIYRVTGKLYGPDRTGRCAYVAWFMQKGKRKAKEAMPEPSDFYASREWLAVRFDALKASNGCCSLCGATANSSGKPLHVDHIKPRSLYPELELEPENLQVLCHDCNMGKGNRDQTDWRKLLEGRAVN